MFEKGSESTPRPHPHSGLFLALEGPDGGGKSTQSARLAAWLRADGFDVVTCRDPGSTKVGDRLRAIVLDRGTIHLSIRAEMLLYMASRAQLVAEVIQPSLAAGRVVISDRFLLSTLVYQGLAGGLPVEELGQIGQTATGGLMPDLTVVLDVPPELARRRAGPARDRIEDRPADYQARVREGYLEVARQNSVRGPLYPCYPAPVVLVSAVGDTDAVFDRIKSEVERVLALGSRT
jgi:dTMP kinase